MKLLRSKSVQAGVITTSLFAIIIGFQNCGRNPASRSRNISSSASTDGRNFEAIAKQIQTLNEMTTSEKSPPGLTPPSDIKCAISIPELNDRAIALRPMSAGNECFRQCKIIEGIISLDTKVNCLVNDQPLVKEIIDGPAPVIEPKMVIEAQGHGVSIYGSYVGKDVYGKIQVHVKGSGPAVLFLSSYESTYWEIDVSPEVDLKKIYINGYKKQNLDSKFQSIVVNESVEGAGHMLIDGFGFNIIPQDLEFEKNLANLGITSYLGCQIFNSEDRSTSPVGRGMESSSPLQDRRLSDPGLYSKCIRYLTQSAYLNSHPIIQKISAKIGFPIKSFQAYNDIRGTKEDIKPEITVTVGEKKDSDTGRLEISVDGRPEFFPRHTLENSLAVCKAKAQSNPNYSVKCIWNAKLIFESGHPQPKPEKDYFLGKLTVAADGQDFKWEEISLVKANEVCRSMTEKYNQQPIKCTWNDKVIFESQPPKPKEEEIIGVLKMVINKKEEVKMKMTLAEANQLCRSKAESNPTISYKCSWNDKVIFVSQARPKDELGKLVMVADGREDWKANITLAKATETCKRKSEQNPKISYKCTWNGQVIFESQKPKEDVPEIGTFVMFVNGNAEAKSRSTLADALRLCKFKAESNPTMAYKCLWNERIIFESQGKKEDVPEIGTFVMFVNGNAEAKSRSTLADALRLCKSKAESNPTMAYKCLWNERIIFESQGKKEDVPEMGTFVMFVNGNAEAKSRSTLADALRLCKFKADSNPTIAFKCLWNERIIFESLGKKEDVPEMGTFVMFVNGKPFVSKVTLSKATELCQYSAKNNPQNTYKCTWNEKVIYDNSEILEKQR